MPKGNHTAIRQRINASTLMIPLGQALRMAIYERLECLEGCTALQKKQAILDLLDELNTLPDLIAEDEELYEELTSPEGRIQLRRDIGVWRKNIRNILTELTWDQHDLRHIIPKSVVKAAYQKWDAMYPDNCLVSGDLGPLFSASI